MSDELPDRLRAAAEGYEPDRDRMWARVSEGMREPRTGVEPVRTGWRIPQVALATGVAVVLIGAIVFFGHAMGIGPVVDPTPEPPAAGPGTRTAEATDPATTEDPSPDATSEDVEQTTGAEATTDAEDVDASADWLVTHGAIDQGSNDYWSQATLTLQNDEPLVALVVELRVAEREDLESTGSWSTDSRFGDAVVTSEDGFLVYRWTLRDDAVLPAGEYTLAGQFGHQDGARSADDDRYTFEAETESGDQGRSEGDFA
ncbi:hypothetical protein K3N28_14085 [Glycomyces sp. TRM65418]|uniref:hypothetical protein n=1 Tax=Glycomyces sp. TRM65418 TaxID=2867006 RepID=UPI001CE6ABD9|nr:hypothetical protein [Glycomyces sp. TRM65418]MCC3764194.1 hypothetical protein [Glycomyces sp. TRM65418]QZD53878.1 hypothetical protein K3N28_14020 [Glycomyces sp. TRM65418]